MSMLNLSKFQQIEIDSKFLYSYVHNNLKTDFFQCD